jgi:peptide chain release factor 1
MGREENSLLIKLSEIDARYSEIESQISDPAIAKDPAKLVALSKEQGKLRSIISKYRQYKKTVAEIEDARHILNDGAVEPDFRALAEEEIEQLTAERDRLLEDIQNMLVMADDMHIGSVIMEIRAGTGGEEAALFARDLYHMYAKYADSRHWRVEQLDFSLSEKGGFREVIFSIKGEGVWSELGYEGGGHRVQRVPETESQGRIHTSAATVAVLPVYEHYERIRRAERDSQRKTMIGSGDRSQKIRTYNFPQNRVTDHRIGLSLYSLDKIMPGDMDELITALREYDRQQRLRNL